MIERSESGSIATLRLAHGKANALDLELLRALDDAIERERVNTPRAVIITGTGNIFSAGVDLFRVTRDGEPYVNEFVPALTSVFRKLFEFPRPVVAAINGHAIAGGCLIASACDYRLMATGRGRIGVPELQVGVTFPPFALELLRFVVPPHHLQDVVYGGATYAPDEALQRGLVDVVTDPTELEQKAIEAAERLGSIDSEVFAATKQQLRSPVLRAFEALGATAHNAVTSLWSSPAALDRISKYLEKTVGRKA